MLKNVELRHYHRHQQSTGRCRPLLKNKIRFQSMKIRFRNFEGHGSEVVVNGIYIFL